MTRTVLSGARFGAWAMDADTRRCIDELAERYRRGRPAIVPARQARLLRAEHLLNQDLDLELFEHPAVLSTMAVGDPFTPNAVAAAARFLPRLAANRDTAAALAAAIGETSRHGRVRDGLALVARYGFAGTALQGLRWLAQRSVEDDRTAARGELTTYIHGLARGDSDPVTLVDDLLAFGYRLSLKPTLFRQMIVNLVESEKMSVIARVRLVRDVQRLPQPLRLEVMTRASLLPSTNPANAAVKRALETVLLQSRRKQVSDPALPSWLRTTLERQQAASQHPVASTRARDRLPRM